MKHFFLLLAFLLPCFSFASLVPPQIPVQLSGSNFSLSPSFLNLNFSDIIRGDYLCPPDFDPSYNRIQFQFYTADSPYLNTASSTQPPVGWYLESNSGSGLPCTDSGNLLSSFTFATSVVSATASNTPGFDFVFVNLNICPSLGCNLTASTSLLGYAKFRYNGTRWVDTLGAGASGSWTFSTSSPINPIDFDDFAQGLKDAIVNNTFQPICPILSDVFDLVVLGSGSWWSECFLPSIVNFLFVPSDSAIDYMIEQMSSNAQYGSSFAYMLIMPIASAVSVTACDLDDVPSCSVGSPLTLPLLDVHGSSTPFVLDPVSPLPAYFDDWLSAIVGVLILAGVSRVVLHKFL